MREGGTETREDGKACAGGGPARVNAPQWEHVGTVEGQPREVPRQPLPSVTLKSDVEVWLRGQCEAPCPPALPTAGECWVPGQRAPPCSPSSPECPRPKARLVRYVLSTASHPVPARHAWALLCPEARSMRPHRVLSARRGREAGGREQRFCQEDLKASGCTFPSRLVSARMTPCSML